MKQVAAVIEFDLASVKKEIASAWGECKRAEKYGLKFGEVCYGWQQKLTRQGTKGEGLRPILDEVGIPKSTAYWWIDRYKESVGIKESKQEKPEYETPPEYLVAARELRKWLEDEAPAFSKRIFVKPCGFGYGAGLRNDGVTSGQTFFDLELRNLTDEEVRDVGRLLEGLNKQ